MGEAIHPLPNFDVDPAVRSDNVTKVVMDNDFFGDDVEMEMHALRVWHGGVEVEIGKVDAQKLGPRGTDGGIDEYFGRSEIGRWCALVAWIVNPHAVNGEPNKMLLFNLWLGSCSKCIHRWGVCELEQVTWG